MLKGIWETRSVGLLTSILNLCTKWVSDLLHTPADLLLGKEP